MKLRCGICALLCVALIAGDAFAQGDKRRGGGGQGRGQGGGMGMFGGGLVSLAKAKDIAAELKLSEDQVKKLDDLEKSSGEKRQKLMQEMRDAGGGGFEGMREKFQELTQQTEKELTGIISADQLKRLKQLQLQSTIKNAGMMAALMNPDTQKAVNLNDEQKEQLRGFQQDSMAQMNEIRQGGGDREEIQKKMAEFRDSMAKKVEKLLTDDQRAKLKELQGEPFKGEFPRLGGGRPRKDGGN